MKFILTTLTLCGLVLLNFSTLAQKPAVDSMTINKATKLRDKALESNLGYDIVESLTTEVGPRMAGTPGDTLAVEWAKAKFTELEFDKIWLEPVTFPAWRRGAESAEVISPFPQPLVITALGNSISTAPEGLEAEIIEFPSLEALEASPEQSASGKIVFVNRRMERHRDGSGYGPVVAARSKGAGVAARKGAVGIVIRSVGTDHDRLAHTGVMRYEDGVEKIPAAALSSPDADLLENMLKRGKPVTIKLNLDAGPAGEFTSHNVIGEITGSERPDEYVLIGAHLDSWDLGTGAIDDGAGVGITVAAAKLIADMERPKRSIRVVLFANEEQGLFGGKAYAEKHQDSITNLIVGAESDFGAGKIWRMDYRVKPEAGAVMTQIHQVLEPLGVEMGSNNTGSGGPDLSPMLPMGIASVSLRQDGTDYFDYHHTPNDTLDKIEPEALAQNVAAYAVLTYIAAQMDGDFGNRLVVEKSQ